MIRIEATIPQRTEIVARLRSGGKPFFLVSRSYRTTESRRRIKPVVGPPWPETTKPLPPAPKTSGYRADLTPERIRAASYGCTDLAAIARKLHARPDTVKRHAAGRIRLPNGYTWRRRESLALRTCIQIMAGFRFTPPEIAELTGKSPVTIYLYNCLYNLDVRVRPYHHRRQTRTTCRHRPA